MRLRRGRRHRARPSLPERAPTRCDGGPGPDSVLIVGVSTRAFAESASRAGYACVSVDAFGDLDQKSRVQNVGLSRDLGRAYSAAAAVAIGRAPVGGARGLRRATSRTIPAAVGRLARGRRLLGNTPATLVRARDPFAVWRGSCGEAGLRVPATLPPGQARHASTGSAVAAQAAARGRRQRRPGMDAGSCRCAPDEMVQERIEGVLASVAFAANGQRGGPARASRGGSRAIPRSERAGSATAAASIPSQPIRRFARSDVATRAGGRPDVSACVGLNGIDFILRDGEPYVLEMNPRYSASMELIERGLKRSAFEIHVAACDGALPRPPGSVPGRVFGKAILWARGERQVGDTRPWLKRDDVRDVPFPGERIRARPADLHGVRRRKRRGGVLRPAGGRCGPYRTRAPDRRGGSTGMTAAAVPQAAVLAAAKLLTQARLPLVYGLVNSTVEAQREAVRIADLLRAVIDTAASPAHHGSQTAFARQGLLTASLGEVKRRANLIVFWGSDPNRLEPGFVERYAPARPGRTRISVDVGPERGPDGVDERLTLAPGRELEALLALRAFVRGRRVEAERAHALGLELGPWRRLGRQLGACGYGAVLCDADPPPERRDPERAGALGALVRDARRKARLRLVGLRMPGNPVGAENVLTWQTGFPSAVSFASGAPRSAPGEFGGETVLARGDVDAALIVGAEPARFLSAAALENLRRLPTVFIGDPSLPESARARVHIATAPLSASDGHVFRMDGVALRQHARPGGSTALPTEAEVLKALAEAILVQADRRTA